MAEYIEREALRKRIRKYCNACDARFEPRICGACGMKEAYEFIKEAPTANVVEVPQEYVYYTDFDDESYLVHFSFPISEKQFKALGEGADLWETLRMDGESDG